jgi:hypothetical protein
MIAFAMVTHHVLRQRPSEVPLTEWNQPVQALCFDRANKPLRVRVAIRRAERRLDDVHKGTFKQNSPIDPNRKLCPVTTRVLDLGTRTETAVSDLACSTEVLAADAGAEAQSSDRTVSTPHEHAP